ncbi:acyltransferase [Pseudarthrobacter sp. BIM B-2242]|nr:acyltransferase [Pseudarthrobacter sp. BIM B-2242]
MKIDIAWSTLVRPGCLIRSRRLTVGRGSTINYACVFDNRAGVRIGDRVGIGIGVKFLNTDHDISDPDCRAGSGKSAGVLVGDGVFIGSNAVILPGVTIGDGAVIGASALVSTDCEPHGLYVGVPARLVRTLPLETEPKTATSS